MGTGLFSLQTKLTDEAACETYPWVLTSTIFFMLLLSSSLLFYVCLFST